MLTKKIQEVDMANDSLFKSVFRDKRSRKMVATVLSHITNIPQDKILSANLLVAKYQKHRRMRKVNALIY